MKSKKSNKKNRYSPIDSHKRDKSKLITPMNQMNMNLFEWERDFLPEHLWIELLAHEYEKLAWYKIYNDFLDRLEDTIEDKNITIYGYLSDFGIVPEKSRKEFLEKHKKFIYNSFFLPIGKILTLYPENPANWLILDEWKDKEKIEFEIELDKLGESIKRLMNAKDLYAGNIRAIPLNRMFQHQKLFLNKGMEIIDLLPKYPSKCTDDEKYRVQSFARIQMNLEYTTNERYKDKLWPKYFWRHNYDLIPCVPTEINISEENRISKEDSTILSENIENNSHTAANYLSKLGMQYKYDLYDPTKDEILLGLFSRLTRLYIVFITGMNLWSRDISGIFLRCYTDTAITFSYLSVNGSEKDFDNFKKYSEGKEKLLMLHLQDTYKGEKTIEDKESDEIADELGGGFNPEFIDIELAGWTKKSAYQLAKESDFEKYYKLVYDPASSDLHGTWTSLKKSNLVFCRISLHRYHKMPSYFEPPLYLSPIEIVSNTYLKCLDIGKKYHAFPKMDGEIKNILDKTKS
jgi:hypothetical protein